MSTDSKESISPNRENCLSPVVTRRGLFRSTHWRSIGDKCNLLWERNTEWPMNSATLLTLLTLLLNQYGNRGIYQDAWT